MTNSMFKLIPVFAAALLLAGCPSTPKKGGQGPAPVDDALGSAQTTGAQAGGAWQGDPLDNPDSLLYTKTIYFDYDVSEVRSDYRDVVIAHGEYLAANPSASLTIEGHCDERGSREYNIGLGERRANAVMRLLMAQGVTANQIIAISYGEERPTALGSHEQAWAQNRRAELLY